MPSVVFTALCSAGSQTRGSSWTRRLAVGVTIRGVEPSRTVTVLVMSGGAAQGREVASGRRGRLAESPGGHVAQPGVSSVVVASAGDDQRVDQLAAVFDRAGLAVHALAWLDQGLAVR